MSTLQPTPNLTPSQTLGPFFEDCLLREDMRAHNVLVTPETQGQHIRLTGHIYDGDGQPVPDAMLEIWQANAAGRYNHPSDNRDIPLDPAFTGWGRSGTDEAGTYLFETIKPGRVPFRGDETQAPHICLAVFARGLLNHLMTRIYFADDSATADDPVLQLVPAGRRATLLARPSGVDEASGTAIYSFDIVLQGAGETAFFNI